MTENLYGLAGVLIAFCFGWLGIRLGKRGEAKRIKRMILNTTETVTQDAGAKVDLIEKEIIENVSEIEKTKKDIQSLDGGSIADRFNSTFSD